MVPNIDHQKYLTLIAVSIGAILKTSINPEFHKNCRTILGIGENSEAEDRITQIVTNIK